MRIPASPPKPEMHSPEIVLPSEPAASVRPSSTGLFGLFPGPWIWMIGVPE